MQQPKKKRPTTAKVASRPSPPTNDPEPVSGMPYCPCPSLHVLGPPVLDPAYAAPPGYSPYMISPLGPCAACVNASAGATMPATGTAPASRVRANTAGTVPAAANNVNVAGPSTFTSNAASAGNGATSTSAAAPAGNGTTGRASAGSQSNGSQVGFDPAQDACLMDMKDEGHTWAQIAAAMGKNKHECQSRFRELKRAREEAAAGESTSEGRKVTKGEGPNKNGSEGRNMRGNTKGKRPQAHCVGLSNAV